jgi:hypothetical protein
LAFPAESSPFSAAANCPWGEEVHREECWVGGLGQNYTDKKENLIFLINKEIQNGAVAMSYTTNSLLIYG